MSVVHFVGKFYPFLDVLSLPSISAFTVAANKKNWLRITVGCRWEQSTWFINIAEQVRLLWWNESGNDDTLISSYHCSCDRCFVSSFIHRNWRLLLQSWGLSIQFCLIWPIKIFISARSCSHHTNDSFGENPYNCTFNEQYQHFYLTSHCGYSRIFFNYPLQQNKRRQIGTNSWG